MINIFIIVLCYSFSQLNYCDGHARLYDPLSRATKWRSDKFKTSYNIEYNDHETNCGGRAGIHQSRGKCGICGDSWSDAPPRKYEAPGKFAQGPVTKHYQPGQIIDATVEVTTNHKGYFTFAICENNNSDRDPDQSCFKKLKIVGSSLPDIVADRFEDKKLPTYIGDKTTDLLIGDKSVGSITTKLQLPQEIKSCSRCILQWTYTGGNDWGVGDGDCSKGGIGCGLQETFRACADVSINAGNPVVSVKPITKPTISMTTPEPPVGGSKPKVCVPTEIWARVPGMDIWCHQNCNHDRIFCFAAHCKCN